jgi:hypothetical protein
MTENCGWTDLISCNPAFSTSVHYDSETSPQLRYLFIIAETTESVDLRAEFKHQIVHMYLTYF